MTTTVRGGYKPCRACGDTEVCEWTSGCDEPGKVIVVTECRGCGNRRGSWTRRKPAKAQEV